MCGRYSLFDEREIADIDRIIREVEERFREKVKTGEIYPTDRAPILLGQDGHPEPAGWGYPHFSGKGVIINARAETAAEKRLFRESLLARRCAVPSTGFYEWAKTGNRQKYWFRLPDEPVLYMAGLYGDFAGERRFVILTTEANPSMEDVHSRMPVILPSGGLLEWINDAGAALERLHGRMPPLVREAV